MRIDIKYGDQIISTIEEKEAQTLATKDTLLTDNITVDVVEAGGIDTSDATASADEIAEGKIAYIAPGRVIGTALQHSSEDVECNTNTFIVPKGIYRETVTKTFPSADLDVVKTETPSEHALKINTLTTLNNYAYIDLTGAPSEATRVTIDQLASGTISVSTEGVHDVANYTDINVALPVYDNDADNGINLLKLKYGVRYLHIIDSYEIDIYPDAYDKTYVGYEQDTTIYPFISELMTLSGLTSATERGTYTCTVALKENYKFKDTLLLTRNLIWHIV